MSAVGGSVVVIEAIHAAAVVLIDVKAFVDRAGAAHGIVGGAFGKGLHRRMGIFLAVAMRIAGVEGAIMMEHLSNPSA